MNIIQYYFDLITKRDIPCHECTGFVEGCLYTLKITHTLPDKDLAQLRSMLKNKNYV